MAGRGSWESPPRPERAPPTAGGQPKGSLRTRGSGGRGAPGRTTPSPVPSCAAVGSRTGTLGGLARMLAAVASFAVMAAFVKVGRAHGMSTAETMFFRMAPGLPWILWEVRHAGAPLAPARPAVTWGRAVLGALAMAGSFFAVRGLTLLQHTVLHLTQPVFVAVLAPALLRERLRGAALLALLLAVTGAIVALEPRTALEQVGHMPLLYGAAGLAAALFSAFAHMSVRLATGRAQGTRSAWVRALTDGRPREAPETIVLHFTLTVSIGAGAVGWLAGDFRALPAGLSHAEALAVIAGMGLFGAAGQLFMSRAYARAPAPMVALVAYAAIPVSVALDALAWGEGASGAALAGAALMVAAGVLLARAR